MNSRGRINVLVWIATAIVIATGSGFCQTSKSRATAKSPLNQARSELARHDLNSAEASVWKVLSSDPNNAEGLLLLGVIRDEQQRYPEAETVLQRAAQLDPKLAAVHIYLGKTYLSENRLPQSLDEYKQAEDLEPNDVEVRVTLARLYAASGDFASALTTLKAVPPARLPEEALPVKVASLLATGHGAEAGKIADSVKNPGMDLALAEVFLRSNQPEEALQMIGVAEASGKRPPPRFYFIKAQALDAAGQQSAALQNFQKAIDLQPSSEEFLLGEAELYAREGKHEQAYEVLQRAYKNDPNSPAVLRPLILEASFAGKGTEVQDAAEQLAKSDDPKDLFVAASVFLKSTRQDEAIPLLQKYLEKYPDDPSAWVGLGLGFEDQKKFPDAQKAFERALQADPKFAEAEYQIAVIADLAGNSSLAMQDYEKALAMDPHHLHSLTKLAKLYMQGGQYEKAREVLLKAESVDPDDRQTEYALALVYSKLGNREEARVHMERFQKKGPLGATEKK
jgi:tetratricopeptide (TPR) repeat protein